MTVVMAWNLATLLTIVFLVGLAWVFYEGYKHGRMEKRRCKCTKNPDGTGGICDAYTIRHFVMIPDDTKVSCWGKHYRWFVLDECIPLYKDHKVHVKLIKQGAKFFNLWKLAWRHFRDPKQFHSREELLVLAGIISNAIPSTFERIRKESSEVRKRAGILKARLDKPQSDDVLVLRGSHNQKSLSVRVVAPIPLWSRTGNGYKLPRD